MHNVFLSNEDYSSLNYQVTSTQAAFSPLISIYSLRHLKAAQQSQTWQGRVIHSMLGVMEALPLIGMMTSVGEAFLCYKLKEAHQKAQEVEIGIDGELEWELKRSAHIFGLAGRAVIPTYKGDKEINLEGFNSHDAIKIISDYFNQFLIADDPNMLLSQADCDWLKGVFTIADRHAITDKECEELARQIQDPKFIGPVCISSGYNEHATFTIFFGPYWIECNRGAGTIGDGSGTKSGIKIHFIPDKSRVTSDIIKKIARYLDMTGKNYLSQLDIVTSGLAKLHCLIGMRDQDVGNCTLASSKAGIFSLLAIREIMTKSGYSENKRFGISPEKWLTAFNDVRPNYKHITYGLRKHEKQRLSHRTIELGKESDSKSGIWYALFLEVLNQANKKMDNKAHVV